MGLVIIYRNNSAYSKKILEVYKMGCTADNIRVDLTNAKDKAKLIEILEKNREKFTDSASIDFNKCFSTVGNITCLDMDGEPLWAAFSNGKQFDEIIQEFAATNPGDFEASQNWVWDNCDDNYAIDYKYSNKTLESWVCPMFTVMACPEDIDCVAFFIAGNDYKYLKKGEIKKFIEENGGDIECAEDAEIIIVGDYDKKEKYEDKYDCEEVISEEEFIFRYWDDEEFAMEVLDKIEADHFACENYNKYNY